LNELLSNAFQGAFPGERSGTVRVSLQESEPGFLELAVEDNSIDLPAGRLTDPNRETPGFRITEILTKQIDGSIQQQPCSGTRIVLRFPRALPNREK